jgi:hypothetical protein
VVPGHSPRQFTLAERLRHSTHRYCNRDVLCPYGSPCRIPPPPAAARRRAPLLVAAPSGGSASARGDVRAGGGLPDPVRASATPRATAAAPRPAGYACCSGVRNLNARGGGPQHRRDRQAACKCLKQITAGSMPALKPDIVAGVHPRQVRRRHPLLPHQPLHRLRQVIL